MLLSVLIIVTLLIALNALYVAAEFAALGTRRTKVQQLAEDGNPTAAYLHAVLSDAERLDSYIAACQVGITLSSLVLGAYGQAVLAKGLAPLLAGLGWVGDVAAESTAAAVVLISLTALQMVLGELVPKSIALQYPTQTALSTARPMRLSLRLLSWFIVVLNGSSNAILRLFGVRIGGHRHIHSPEEIELLIAESRDGGLLEPDEHRRLHRALRLGARPVSQLMVPRLRMDAIDVESPPDEVLRRVIESPYTRLPVYRGNRDTVIGVIHTEDLARHMARYGDPPSVERLVRPVAIIPETATGERLLRLLRERRCHQAIVVNEFGGVEGLVTLDDVLEELLGEVQDELKDAEDQPEHMEDGRVRLPGAMRLDDAEPWIGLLWHGRAETIAGHVIEVLGRLPDEGEQVTVEGVEVEILRVEGVAVTSLAVRPRAPEPPADPDA